VRTAYVAWAICQAGSLPELRGAVTEIGLEDETVAREAPTPLSSVSQPSTCPTTSPPQLLEQPVIAACQPPPLGPQS
jgi:hypothetical protein